MIKRVKLLISFISSLSVTNLELQISFDDSLSVQLKSLTNEVKL